MNDSVSGPTQIMKGNQATIIQIRKDRLTLHIRQFDILLT